MTGVPDVSVAGAAPIAASISGLRAIVTGSSRGLGAAIARDLAARGAHVVINGTDSNRCHAIARDLDAPVVVGSVADEGTVSELIDTCVRRFGGLDLLVNNAGITRDGMLAKVSVADFDAVVAVHLRGTWLACRAAARAMRSDGGSILNVVSGTALYGNVGQSAYAAAKGGILALTRALALELQRSRIRVNAIAPVARTEMVMPLLEINEELAPLFGAPQDVAPVVALLASSAATDVSGIVVGFDGQRLCVWTHPSSREAVVVAVPSSLDELAQAFRTLPRLTPNPDALGGAVHRLLGVRD